MLFQMPTILETQDFDTAQFCNVWSRYGLAQVSKVNVKHRYVHKFIVQPMYLPVYIVKLYCIYFQVELSGAQQSLFSM